MAQRQEPFIGSDAFGGCFVEWYRDDDDNSGNGDNPQFCRWYGTHNECAERIKQPPPADGWITLASRMDGPPPYDAATATGMYDRW